MLPYSRPGFDLWRPTANLFRNTNAYLCFLSIDKREICEVLQAPAAPFVVSAFLNR